MDRRCSLGARRHLRPSGPAPLRTPAQGSGTAIPLHERGRDRQARLPSRCDDPRRESVTGTGTGCSWAVHGRRAVSERLRRRRRRAGADQRRFGWNRPPWFALQAEEHRAFRERVGIIDMTSFGKIELDGPGALALLERVCGNQIDRPVGTVVYTQLLDRRGGIAGDVTITRLGPERMRLVTGAGYVNSDLGW